MAAEHRTSRGPLDPRSVEFLVDDFTALREERASEIEEGGPTAPDPRKAAREIAAYDALVAALEGEAPFPHDEDTRERVASMLRATDKENDYEQVVLEHRAFSELLARLER